MKPPVILTEVWLDIYYSHHHPENAEAQTVIKDKLLKYFGSVEAAEMHLYTSLKKKNLANQ